jgi:hypothetical protein
MSIVGRLATWIESMCAAASPRLVVRRVEARVDVEGGFATPAAEGLDLRPRRARGQQAARALDPAAVGAVSLGTLGPDATDEDGVALPRSHCSDVVRDSAARADEERRL